jgi:hypothetical protein
MNGNYHYLGERQVPLVLKVNLVIIGTVIHKIMIKYELNRKEKYKDLRYYELPPNQC